MGLIFCDSFDGYGFSTDVPRNWSGLTISGWTFNSTAGRNGGGAMTAVSVANPGMAIPLNLVSVVANSNTQVGACFWFKGSAAPATNTGTLFGTYNTGISAVSWFLQIQASTGILRLMNASSLQLTIGSTNICDNTWHWIEVIGAAGNNPQNYKCYVDGAQQWNGNFQCGSGNNIVNVAVGATSSATNTYTIDDFFVFDQQTNESPLPANVPIGARQIDLRSPNGDSLKQFTPNSGATNYTQVDDSGSGVAAADEDTTYVQDNTSGHADEYTYSSLGFTPSSITAVQMVTRVKNPSGGSVQYKERCHSGAMTSDGSAITAAASYTNSRRALNYDPNTSAAWTPPNLGNAKFGFTVV